MSSPPKSRICSDDFSAKQSSLFFGAYFWKPEIEILQPLTCSEAVRDSGGDLRCNLSFRDCDHLRVGARALDKP